MALTQSLFKRFVKLFRLDVLPLLQVLFHEFLIQFDDLVDDIDVGLCDGQKVRVFAFRLKKTVHDFGSACCRQIQGQTFASVGFPELLQHGFRIYAIGINLVHNHQAVQSSFSG